MLKPETHLASNVGIFHPQKNVQRLKPDLIQIANEKKKYETYFTRSKISITRPDILTIF